MAGAIASLLADLLKATGKSFAISRLERAIAESLKSAVAKAQVPRDCSDQVVFFLRLPRTAHELAKLFGEGREEPDPESLLTDLEKEGLDPSTLRGVDMVALLNHWMVSFCEACLRDPDLHTIVATPFKAERPFRTVYDLRRALFAHYVTRLGRLPALGLFSAGEQSALRSQVDLKQVYVPFRACPHAESAGDFAVIQDAQHPFLQSVQSLWPLPVAKTTLPISTEIRSETFKLDTGVHFNPYTAVSLSSTPASRWPKSEEDASRRTARIEGISGLELWTRWWSYYTPETTINNLAYWGPKVVITGDPGSGKSALLRYIATTLACEDADSRKLQRLLTKTFPLVMSVGAYAKDTSVGPGSTPVEFLDRYYRRHSLPGMRRLLEHHLRGGDCLIMIDGLDEVVDLGVRQQIVGLIESFVSAHEAAGNRFLVTSRSTGYNEAPLESGFVRLNVSPFNLREKRMFLRKWCLAFETLDGDNAERRRHAREVASELAARVEQVPEISKLATNPLLLTILAMIHYQAKRLPHRRVELYDCYLETFAEAWHRARDIADVEVQLVVGDVEVNERSVVMALGPVAAKIHEREPGGVVSHSELIEELGRHFSDGYLMPPAKAAQCADAFIRIVLQQVGLMSERGHGYFGFIHQTFEEHLIARHLAARTPELRWQYLSQRLHDPRWQEVVLLTAGSLQGDNVDVLVERILQCGSSYEAILRRDLILATRVLADDTRVTSGALWKRVLDGFIALACDTPYAAQRQSACDLIERFVGGGSERHIRDALEDRLMRQLPRLDTYLLSLLAKLGWSEGKFLDVIEDQSRDPNSDARCEAAQAIAVLGVRNATARAILHGLTGDPVGHVVVSAARAMASDKTHNAQATEVLLGLLKHAMAKVRATAAHTLGVLKPGHSRVRDGLRAGLHDKSELVRVNAAWALAELRPRTQVQVAEIVGTLVHRGKDRDSYFYGQADEGLAEGWPVTMSAALCVPPKDKRFIPELLKLSSHRSRITRARALLGLGRLDLLTSAVEATLRARLSDRSTYVQLAAISSLLTLDAADSATTDALLRILMAGDPPAWHASKLFKRIRHGRDQVEATLVQRLTDRNAGDSGIDMVLESLVGLQSRHPAVIDALVQRLADEPFRTRRSEAISALVKVNPGNVTLVTTLQRDLDSPDEEARLVAMLALSDLGIASSRLMDLLEEQLSSAKGDTEPVLTLAYARRRQAQDSTYDALLKLSARIPPSARDSTSTSQVRQEEAEA